MTIGAISSPSAVQLQDTGHAPPRKVEHERDDNDRLLKTPPMAVNASGETIGSLINTSA
jgi:hypothetical protein